MKRLLLSAIAAALLQIGFLCWVIVSRAAVLRSGAEVLLKVEPVDPRDLLRGDYVQLGYEISNLPVALIADRASVPTITEASEIIVRLHRGGDGFWRATVAYFGAPPAAQSGDVDIAGHVAAGWSLEGDASIHVDYGIERFYLPEGEGRAVERDMRTRSFGIRAAVAKSGAAQIKALEDGGTVIFAEPLY